MRRLTALLLALFALAWSLPAAAQVTMSFHSFNGSLFFGRYPHTFIVLRGTLEDGTRVNENYGFSADASGPEVLAGPAKQKILIEKDDYIVKTNRHFTIPISDATYYQAVAEMKKWRDAPGKYYNLKSRNCIHFVGRMAELAGLKVDYPRKLLRKPRAWLNYISGLNPSLGAKPIKG